MSEGSSAAPNADSAVRTEQSDGNAGQMRIYLWLGIAFMAIGLVLSGLFAWKEREGLESASMGRFQIAGDAIRHACACGVVARYAGHPP